MKIEASQHICQLNRGKDSIYSAVGVNTLMLIKDINANLDPAGTYQVTKLTTKLGHVRDLTAKWIEMATKLNHEAALRLLTSGDVASNELYYDGNIMTLSDSCTVNSPSPNPIRVRVCAIQNPNR